MAVCVGSVPLLELGPRLRVGAVARGGLDAFCRLLDGVGPEQPGRVALDAIPDLLSWMARLG